MRKTGLLLIALACAAAQTPELTSEQVVALAKTFFRDTGERPMDVRVTKVVTDASGKLKRRSQSSFRVVYQGKSTLRFAGGSLGPGGLFASMSDSSFLDAAMKTLAPETGEPAKFEIKPPAADGAPYLVTVKAPDSCQPMKLARNWLVPQDYPLCASYQYTLSVAPPASPVLEHFRLDLANLPAPAKLADLGNVQIRSFRAEGDFRKAFLPGDAQPYLLPRQVVSTLETDKGWIQITNQYSPRIANK